MKLIEKYSQNLYQKIRNRFDRISMVDEDGKLTVDEKLARIFNMLFLKNNTNTMVTISIMDPSELKVYFDKKMAKKMDQFDRNKWFEFLNELRKFTVMRQMSFDLVDLEKPGLDEKDIRAMITSRQNVAESKFSSLSGSTKTSYQMLEKVKIKAKHKKIINDDIRGSRSRNIKALFIENSQGERFRFPFLNLAGVRAMARHLEEGGDWNDHIGHHILEMTSNLCTIKEFVREVRKQKIVNESFLPMLQQLREKQTDYRRKLLMMSGSKGYHSYVSAITEIYVEPVNPISEYFSAVHSSIQKYIPAIEKILGEKSVEGITDEVISEQSEWGLKKFLFEQTPVAGTPATAPVAGTPAADQGLKIPKKFPKGKKVKVDQRLLQQIGITNPQAEAARIPSKEKNQYLAALKSGELEMPIVSYNKDYGQYSIDPSAKNLVSLLISLSQGKDVFVWAVDNKEMQRAGGFFSNFGRAFNRAQSTASDIVTNPLGQFGATGLK